MEIFFLLLLLILMAGALGSGFPVAFALPGSAILTIGLAAGAGYLFEGHTDAFFVHGGPAEWLSAGVRNLRGVYWEPDRDTLIAIPLFIFMGIMLQRSKIAEDLLVSMARLFGPVPGGLGISVVVVGALLAATTGIVGATVVAMGLISLPAMQARNYSMPLATGAISASGTLGQIIPPSIVLIILADQLSSAVDQADNTRKALYKDTTGELSMPSEFAVSSTSAGDMFQGAIVPGLLLVGLYIAYILIVALLRPQLAPPVSSDEPMDAKFLKKLALSLLPPLVLIFLVLGSIITGVATVNQAGAIGAAGATLMAGYRLTEGRKTTFVPALMAVFSVLALALIISNFDTNVQNISSNHDRLGVALAAVALTVLLAAIFWSAWRTYVLEDTLRGVMIETAKTTCFVFIILLGAAMLTAAFRAFGGEELIRDFLNGMPGGFWTKFVIVMSVIFVLGFFLDYIEIAIVVIPIVAPILLSDPSANVSAVWLGVMVGLNMQTSFLTPPFGFALFYLRGVTPPSVTTKQIYKGVVPFILIQLLALGIVGAYPSLVNRLPTITSLNAPTAPPPKNPRLQYCIEQHVSEEFAIRGDDIRAGISAMRVQNLSLIPAELRERFLASLEGADSAFAAMYAVSQAEEIRLAESTAYVPLHSAARGIEREIRRVDMHIRNLTEDLRDVERKGEPTEQIEERIAELESQKARLTSSIPEAWPEAHARFSEITETETNARRQYRRLVDSVYETLLELQNVVNSSDDLESYGRSLDQLETTLPALERAEAADEVKKAISQLSSIAGTDGIASVLRDARREFKRRSGDRENGLRLIADAKLLVLDEVTWRRSAATELSGPLNDYQQSVSTTIGLRSLSRLPETVTHSITACVSQHRDISLNF
jgi:tripartite ATP-independent transporter DctM subunit